MKLKMHGLILLLSCSLEQAGAMDDFSTTDEEYSSTSAPNNVPNLTRSNTVYENKRLNQQLTLAQIPAPILRPQLSESSDDEVVDIIPLYNLPRNIDNRMTDEVGGEIPTYTEQRIGAQLYYYPLGIPNAHPLYALSVPVYNPFIVAGDTTSSGSIFSDMGDSDDYDLERDQSDSLPFKFE